MIHHLVKIISVDGFYSKEQANHISSATLNLQYKDFEFGSEIENFNLIPPDFNELISSITGSNLRVDEDSGNFRIPKNFIHFEGFDGTDEWIFVVALQESTFNVFEHLSGVATALQGYKHNYMDLFQWDLTVNIVLKPGQGVLFRPWLFHSFSNGQIQLFKLREIS